MGQRRRITDRPVAPDFHPPMSAPERLRRVPIIVCIPCLLTVSEGMDDFVVHRLVILLEHQHVVRSLLYDLRRDLPLTTRSAVISFDFSATATCSSTR
jgi:hypothetical protein